MNWLRSCKNKATGLEKEDLWGKGSPMQGSLGQRTTLLLWLMLLIGVGRCVSLPILDGEEDIHATMAICLMSCAGTFPLTASRSIIQLIQANRLPRMWSMQRHIV